MRIIELTEPCFVREYGADIKHVPTETCKRFFGWDSPCESIQFILRDDEPDVDLNAIVDIGDDGITLAQTDKLGMAHYFFPWSSVVAVQGRIRT